MDKAFTRGLIIGGIVGASIGMMRNSNMMSGRNRKRIMKAGRKVMRQSGQLVSNIVDMFR